MGNNCWTVWKFWKVGKKKTPGFSWKGKDR